MAFADRSQGAVDPSELALHSLALEVHSQHVGNRIDEVPLLRQEGPFGFPRPFFQIGDLDLTGLAVGRREACPLHPRGVSEMRRATVCIPVSESRRRDLWVPPPAGKGIRDLLQQPRG
jgi:hypothetical protein